MDVAAAEKGTRRFEAGVFEGATTEGRLPDADDAGVPVRVDNVLSHRRTRGSGGALLESHLFRLSIETPEWGV